MCDLRIALAALATAAVAACADRPSANSGAPAPHDIVPAAAPAAPRASDAGALPMPHQHALPQPFDVRVARALAESLADDVVIAVDHVAREKSLSTNYRWVLHRDGRLFYVQHSGQPGDWQVPFDRPLPDKPALRLAASRVGALVDVLDAGGFFAAAGPASGAPGYASEPREGGSYWIVRARKAGDLRAIVLENTRPAYLNELLAISDPLWTQPN